MSGWEGSLRKNRRLISILLACQDRKRGMTDKAKLFLHSLLWGVFLRDSVIACVRALTHSGIPVAKSTGKPDNLNSTDGLHGGTAAENAQAPTPLIPEMMQGNHRSGRISKTGDPLQGQHTNTDWDTTARRPRTKTLTMTTPSTPSTLTMTTPSTAQRLPTSSSSFHLITPQSRHQQEPTWKTLKMLRKKTQGTRYPSTTGKTLDVATDPKDVNTLAATSSDHHPRPRLQLRQQEQRLRRSPPQPRLRQQLRPRHARVGGLALAQYYYSITIVGEIPAPPLYLDVHLGIGPQQFTNKIHISSSSQAFPWTTMWRGCRLRDAATCRRAVVGAPRNASA